MCRRAVETQIFYSCIVRLRILCDTGFFSLLIYVGFPDYCVSMLVIILAVLGVREMRCCEGGIGLFRLSSRFYGLNEMQEFFKTSLKRLGVCGIGFVFLVLFWVSVTTEHFGVPLFVIRSDWRAICDL